MNPIVDLAMDRLRRSLSCEQMDFPAFIPAAWPLIDPSNAFLPNWHVDCIAEHLQAVTIGQIQFLVINLPPRNAKSNIVSTLWPAWSWTKRPGQKWIFLSYSQSLAQSFSKNRRDLICSDWYQQRWGSIVQIAADQNEKREFMNTARGAMVATSVGGTLTGKGADVIVIDDGIDPERANSKADREAAISFVKGTVSTRLNNKRTGCIIEVSQRTHVQDISGTLLSEGIYVHLNLPAIAEKKTIIEFPISKRVVTREAGDILHPEREDKAILDRQKKQMTVDGKSLRTFQSQYQQNPASDEGSMFPRSCWKFHKITPYPIWRMWTWDTAMEEGEENDWTVGVYLVFHAAGVCVERVVRARLQYPELKQTVTNEVLAFPCNELLVENKVSGMSLAQDLKKTTDIPVIAYPRKVGDGGERDVRGDKVFRASIASPYMQSGRVSLKEGEIWVPEFIEEFAAFPGMFKDQVDATCQGINYFYQGSQRPATVLIGSGISMPTHSDKGANGIFRGRPSWA